MVGSAEQAAQAVLQSLCDQVQLAEVVLQEAAMAREKAFRRDTQAAAELAEFLRLVVLARSAGSMGAVFGRLGARARPCCAGLLGLGYLLQGILVPAVHTPGLCASSWLLETAA